MQLRCRYRGSWPFLRPGYGHATLKLQAHALQQLLPQLQMRSKR